MDNVSIVKIKDNVPESVRRALSLIGDLNFARTQTIFIKPNICTEVDPLGGANTSTRIVRAIIDEVLRKERNSIIRIIESNSFGKYIDKAFKKFGYLEIEGEYQDYDVSLINLSKEPTKTISLNGLYLKKIELPKILLQPRFYISVAKAKTHGLTQITGVLKNQFGILPEKNKSRYHTRINEVILDLNKIFRPDISIIDGTVCMEGSTEGGVKKLGLILCGTNPVPVDATLARIMGFDPSKIKHIVLAERHGLGTTHPRVVGEQIESVAIKLHKPHTTFNLISQFLYLRLLPENMRPIARSVYRRLLGGIKRIQK